MAYTLIETVTVGSGGAASIEFTSIPQDGVDLLLKLSTRTDRAANTDNIELQVNSNTGSIYTHKRLQGTGSGVFTGSFTGTVAYIINNGNNDTSNTFGNADFLIANYTSSANKSCSSDAVNENNATLAYQDLKAHLIADTNPITSIQLAPDSGTNFLQYSTASLYKIS